MNQLNKLIQQYERENPGETAYVNPPMNLDFSSKFTRWLASRPTCGKEQRKFLDEVEKGKIEGDEVFDKGGDLILFTCDWEFLDLQKVIEGK